MNVVSTKEENHTVPQNNYCRGVTGWAALDILRSQRKRRGRWGISGTGWTQERSELCLEEVEPDPCLGSSTSEPTPIALYLVVCTGLPRLIGIETFTPGKGMTLAAGSQQAEWPHPIPYPCFKLNSSVLTSLRGITGWLFLELTQEFQANVNPDATF